MWFSFCLSVTHLVVKKCHFDTHLSYFDRYIVDSFVIIFTAETHIYGFTVCITAQYTWPIKGNPPMDGQSGLQVNKNNMFLIQNKDFFSCRCPKNVRFARPTHQYTKTKKQKFIQKPHFVVFMTFWPVVFIYRIKYIYQVSLSTST